jgi:hypothetical protein
MLSFTASTSLPPGSCWLQQFGIAQFVLLIPNIIYYLSFTIPVSINQRMDVREQSTEPKVSPLVV